MRAQHYLAAAEGLVALAGFVAAVDAALGGRPVVPWLAWGVGWLLLAGYEYRETEGWRDAPLEETAVLVVGAVLVLVSVTLLVA